MGKHSVVIPSKTAASLSVEGLEVLMSFGLCWECQAFSHVTAVSVSPGDCVELAEDFGIYWRYSMTDTQGELAKKMIKVTWTRFL